MSSEQNEVSQPQPPSQPTRFSSGTPEPRRKRARPTVSCLECRRKKLKCDRVQPCMQCKKSGRSDICTYASRGSSAPHASPSDEDGKQAWARIENYNSPGSHAAYPLPLPINSTPFNPGIRVRDLCSSTGDRGFNGGEVSTPIDPDIPPRKGYLEQPLGRLRVQGNLSRYEGPCEVSAMLNHFEDAKQFLMACCKGNDMVHLFNELKSYQMSFTLKFKSTPYQGTPGVPLKVEMANALPSEGIWNATLPVYVENWENVLRILHIPSFILVATEFYGRRKMQWAGPDIPGITDALIAQMLLVVSIASRLRGLETSERDRAMHCELVEKWLSNLPSRDMLTMEALRVQVLLLVARQANLVPTTELWQSSGTVVRAAMLMGLQRDPEACQNISPFEKEQRRKLWSTILELDFQISLACDMPPVVRWLAISKGSLSTLNVDDLDLLPDTLEYPQSKPLHQYTDSVTQISLTFSLVERLAIADIMGNNSNLDESLESLLQRAINLENGSYSLPRSLGSDAVWNRQDKSSGRLFAAIMLDIYHLRPLLHVFRSVASYGQTSQCPKARKRALRYSVSLLFHLDALDPTVADVDTIKSRDYLNLFHILCKNDIIQAALVLCYEIQAFNSTRESSIWNDSQQSPIRSHALPENSMPWTKHSLTRIVENTLNSLFQRLGDFGSDFKDALKLATVLQYVRCNGTAEDKHASMVKGAERVLKACRDVLPGKAIHPMEGEAVSTPPQHPSMPSLAPTEAFSDGKPAVSFQRQHPLKVKHHFGDMNMIPGAHVDFSDFDFGLADWDQPWL